MKKKKLFYDKHREAIDKRFSEIIPLNKKLFCKTYVWILGWKLNNIMAFKQLNFAKFETKKFAN